MPSTKLWLVNHVAMAMTARPMVEANSTRQPSCSRIGIRILTILRPGDVRFPWASEVEGRGASDAAAISQLHFARAGQRARRGNREACRVVCIPFLVASACVYECGAGSVSCFQVCWRWESLAARAAGVRAGVLE
jgi:hypothetical protein